MFPQWKGTLHRQFHKFARNSGSLGRDSGDGPKSTLWKIPDKRYFVVSWREDDKVPMDSQNSFNSLSLVSSNFDRLFAFLFGFQTNVSLMNLMKKHFNLFLIPKAYGKFTSESQKGWKFWNITLTTSGTSTINTQSSSELNWTSSKKWNTNAMLRVLTSTNTLKIASSALVATCWNSPMNYFHQHAEWWNCKRR